MTPAQPRAFDREEWRRPPADRNDKAGWDLYWSGRVKARNPHDLYYNPSIIQDLVPAAARLNLKTVLCAGNGISVEPYALAASGFDVTAVDLSSVATDYINSFEFGQDFYEHYCGAWRPTRIPGKLTFLQGDLRAPVICTGPFDIIRSRDALLASSRNCVSSLARAGTMCACTEGVALRWSRESIVAGALRQLLGA